MIGILTGDIVGSRHLADQQLWIAPLKEMFESWKLDAHEWLIYRGDSFQVQITDPRDALIKAIQIKGLIKSIRTEENDKRSGQLDIRIAIGIGESGHQSDVITESNGPAFIYSGELYENLKERRVNLAVKSEWKDFDEEMNLYIRLGLIAMDHWTISAGKLIVTIIEHQNKTQEEIGTMLDIEQNSVSGRYKRAHIDEIMALEKMYREKLNQLLS